MVPTSAPVSSASRSTKAGPPRLTSAFAIIVAMISRRSRWPAMASAKRSRIAVGK